MSVFLISIFFITIGVNKVFVNLFSISCVLWREVYSGSWPIGNGLVISFSGFLFCSLLVSGVSTIPCTFLSAVRFPKPLFSSSGCSLFSLLFRLWVHGLPTCVEFPGCLWRWWLINKQHTHYYGNLLSIIFPLYFCGVLFANSKHPYVLFEVYTQARFSFFFFILEGVWLCRRPDCQNGVQWCDLS